MTETILYWLSNNYIEVAASLFGLISIYFGIKEKPIFWIFAFINAVFFVFVYFDKKIYALMLLQFYYISLSFYGFYYWIKGGKSAQSQQKVPIKRLENNKIMIGALVFIFIYFFLTAILKYFTDSTIPFIDAIITTFSIFASFLMTKKYIEHWFLWVVSDIISIVTFAHQQMFATMIMYLFFLSSAFIGFFQWKKEFQKQKFEKTIS